MQCTLLIPDLLPPQPPGGMLDLYHGLHVPDLQWFLARGRLHAAPGADLESWLLQAHASADVSAVASLSWLADGGESTPHYRLRADPVHLQAQRDQLVLVDGALLDITRDEADAFVAALSQHFEQDGLRFHAPHPTRWYLALEADPELITTPLPRVAGLGINTHLPRGADGLRWNRILTEAQMLLHAHPVNQAREARNLPAINSVWLWGGGRLPHLAGDRTDTQIWSDDPLARGLALARNQTAHPRPRTLDAFLAGAPGDGKHTLLLDDLRRPAWYGDHATWRSGVERLENDWIKPLCDALRHGTVSAATLHAISPHGCLSATLTGRARWRFWRRAHPLAHYAPRD